MNRPQLAAEFSESRLTPGLDQRDVFEQMAVSDRADWGLLRLVLCAAGATLLLALASSLGA